MALGLAAIILIKFMFRVVTVSMTYLHLTPTKWHHMICLLFASQTRIKSYLSRTVQTPWTWSSGAAWRSGRWHWPCTRVAQWGSPWWGTFQACALCSFWPLGRRRGGRSRRTPGRRRSGRKAHPDAGGLVLGPGGLTLSHTHCRSRNPSVFLVWHAQVLALRWSKINCPT